MRDALGGGIWRHRLTLVTGFVGAGDVGGRDDLGPESDTETAGLSDPVRCCASSLSRFFLTSSKSSLTCHHGKANFRCSCGKTKMSMITEFMPDKRYPYQGAEEEEYMGFL